MLKRGLFSGLTIGLPCALLVQACDLSVGTTQKAEPVQVGEASWYGPGLQGQETASGEIYDPNKLTAAHPSLPEGSRVRVTNLDNGKSVKVRVNDRGPYVDDRVIDVSRKAAKALDMIEEGTATVKVELLSQPPATEPNDPEAGQTNR